MEGRKGREVKEGGRGRREGKEGGEGGRGRREVEEKGEEEEEMDLHHCSTQPAK